jgi:hypothetical protein
MDAWGQKIKLQYPCSKKGQGLKYKLQTKYKPQITNYKKEEPFGKILYAFGEWSGPDS